MLLKRLRKRTYSELLLLSRALAWVCAIRIGLWCASLARLQRIVAALTRPTSNRSGSFSVEQLSWAVSVASCYVPRATCLTQAVALHILLKRRGFPSRIQIGVAKEKGGPFEAHAWVESQGRVVIGNWELDRFTTMMIWD